MKKITSLFFLFFNFLVHAQHHHDPPSVHGMLLFGEKTIYLSHLPMFHNPHDYQVIFKVKLPQKIKKEYLLEKAKDPEQTVYTIVPEVFVLPQMIKEPKDFSAILYKGHFERGGEPITKSFKIEIENVIYNKKFDKSTQKPKSGKYLLIGNSEEQFLIHEIFKKPDFDYISQVIVKNPKIIKDLINRHYLEFKLQSSNEKPFKSKRGAKIAMTQADSDNVFIYFYKSLYTEFRDLSF